MTFQPMLAHRKHPDLNKVEYPVMASYKADGFRVITRRAGAFTRTLTPLPNKQLAAAMLELPMGFDGELLWGDITAPGVFNSTQAAVTTHQGSVDGFTYYVFDLCDEALRECPYIERFDILKQRVWDFVRVHPNFPIQLIVPPTVFLHSRQQVENRADAAVAEGWEGLILRNPGSPYKWGRSTEREGYMLKVKTWDTSEATIIGFNEALANLNELHLDARGYAKRATKKDKKEAKDTLGSLQLRDLETGKEFGCKGGIDDQLAQFLWDNQETQIGQIVSYKYQGLTPKGLPRFPGLIGFRDPIDIVT